MNLLFVGDVMLGRMVNEALRHLPAHYPWGDTLTLFAAADVRICNLECVIADDGTPWIPKVFHFRSDAKNVAVLKAARMDCVSLANNHTLDFGYDAMFEMLAVLDQAGIHYTGADRDLESASQPAIFSWNGVRIGCVAFTDNEPSWEATSTTPGVFYTPVDLDDARAQSLLEIVTRTRPLVDWLIVCAHWGPNWGYHPQPWHIPFAHALIDSGADVVFGHSCHVFQGIEFYRSRPILYSCGDFVDDYRVHEVERNDESFIFVVEVGDGVVEQVRLYPTYIENRQARLARGREAEAIAARMQTLCAGFGTASIWNETTRCLEVPVV